MLIYCDTVLTADTGPGVPISVKIAHEMSDDHPLIIGDKRKLHLVIDGYGAPFEKLGDTDLVYRFLNEYPDAIGMTKIVPPQVYTYHGKTREDWGVSGFVIIAESHISVHTFPDRQYVNIDIFSCKDFNANSSLEVVKRTFGLPQVKVWTLERGIEYATPREGYNGMVRERVSIGAPSSADAAN